MEVKDLGKSAGKFKTRAGAASGDYADGAVSAAGRWKTAVEASEDTWKEGVAAAAARGAFKRGLAKAPADYYAERVKKLGQARYGQGVAEGAGNWQEGFAPFADALKAMPLPAKGPKGDPRNQQRSVEVQIRLRNVKTGQAA